MVNIIGFNMFLSDSVADTSRHDTGQRRTHCWRIPCRYSCSTSISTGEQTEMGRTGLVGTGACGLQLSWYLDGQPDLQLWKVAGPPPSFVTNALLNCVNNSCIVVHWHFRSRGSGFEFCAAVVTTEQFHPAFFSFPQMYERLYAHRLPREV